MLNNNSTAKMKWNYRNKQRFTQLGYKFTKPGDEFEVKVSELSPWSTALMEPICDYCNEPYSIKHNIYVDHHRNLNTDCCGKPECKRMKNAESTYIKNRDRAFDKLEEICRECGYILITKREEYTDAKMWIYFICPKHGIQKHHLNDMLSSHACRCSQCLYDKMASERRINTKTVIAIIERIDGNTLINPEDYKDIWTENLRIRCRCGEIFLNNLSNYKNGIRILCPNCLKSYTKGELRIKDYLTKNNIAFVPQHTFDDCKYINVLRFDFYLPSYNLIVEYDGAQHFFPIDFFGGENAFIETVKRDQIKNDYCKQNGINMLRISYKNFEDIETIIETKIKELE